MYLSDRGQCLVASPDLIRRFDYPVTPAELNDWLSLGLGDRPQQNFTWELYGAKGEKTAVHHRPRFITTDMMALRAAALAGTGVAQLPLLVVREQLADRSLMQLLSGWTPRREIIHAVFPSRRGLLPSVRTLIDYRAECYAGFDEP
ncbi:LysR substrate-binding domain-containing protein [Methylomonas sp. MgM2]